MTAAEARDLVQRCLADIAPDVDASALAGDAPLRQTLELDSMDVLNLVAAIADESGVEIPDRDVARLTTLDELADHIAQPEVTR